MEARAGARWQTVKRTIAFVAAVKPSSPKEAALEDEPDEYPGACASALRDVCEAAGFAFAELWIRPKFEMPGEEDREAQVQWDHLLRYAKRALSKSPVGLRKQTCD